MRFAPPVALALLAACGDLQVPARGPLAFHDLLYTSVGWGSDDDLPDSEEQALAGNDELWLLRTDGSVEVLVQARPGGGISGATWSPDGMTVAFSVAVDDPTYLMDAGVPRTRLERVQRGGSPEILAEIESGSVQDPCWSPDGTRLLALLRLPPPRGVPRTRVLLVDARGGDARLLSPPGVDVGSPRWSRDGRLALYLATGSGELRALEVETGESRVIASEPEGIDAFAVAPDVDRVLINTLDRTYTVDLDGNDFREIGKGWGESFAYAPGGDMLAFLRTISGDHWLFVSTPAGGNEHALATIPVRGRFAWAPGGDWVAFATIHGKIEVRSASGQDVIEATRGDRFHIDPAWRP